MFLALGYLKRNLDPSPEHIPSEGCCFPSLQSPAALARSATFASQIHGFLKALGGLRYEVSKPKGSAGLPAPCALGIKVVTVTRGLAQGEMDCAAPSPVLSEQAGCWKDKAGPLHWVD